MEMKAAVMRQRPWIEKNVRSVASAKTKPPAGRRGFIFGFPACTIEINP
jgi:hypothetical protein